MFWKLFYKFTFKISIDSLTAELGIWKFNEEKILTNSVLTKTSFYFLDFVTFTNLENPRKKKSSQIKVQLQLDRLRRTQ